MLAVTLAAAAVNWTLYPNTRCHNDVVQWAGVADVAACEAACLGVPTCHLFTYCPKEGGDGCSAGGGGPVPQTCWGYELDELSGCETAAGWTSGSYPATPTQTPLPPPPDWARAVAAGDMAFAAGNVYTPDAIGEGLYPVLGNGNFGVEMGPSTQPWRNAWPWRDAGSFHLAGVFNGVSWTTPSHRAQLPKVHDVTIVPQPGGSYAAVGTAIDYRGAVWLNRTNVSAPGCVDTSIEQRAYAHRVRRELFVFELVASSASGDPAWAGCALPVQWRIGPASADANLAVVAPGNASAPTVWAGSTLEAEEPGLPLRSVAIALDAWAAAAPATLSFTPAAPRITLRAVLRSDLDVAPGASPAAVATAAASSWATAAALAPDALFATHAAAWDSLWASGGVELAGNASLAATVNASLYDILSSLRADLPYSTSPGGLGTGGYCGHSFWDFETWMLPVLAVLHPDVARAALQYRIDRVNASLENARLSGYDGAMWAWESAVTGLWTAPCRQCDINENHISADIPLGMRKLYYATGDEAFLAAAWPALNATCRFWECRFRRTDSTGGGPPPGYAPNCSPKDGVGNWTVYSVVPPDESSGVTNDSVYTNAAAAETLDFCIEAATLLGHLPVPALWTDMAAAPYLPLSDTLFSGGTVHVQDGQYVRPRTINQADVALLQYPLGVNMDESLRRRDLDFYASVTNFGGMFTGDTSYAAGYLALGNRTAADAQLGLAFNHLSIPFNVFTEEAPAATQSGTQHFITGSGGFLQAFVFGYAGLRIARPGVLSFSSRAPVLPPLGVSSVKLRGLHVLGTPFDFEWDATQLCVTVQPVPPGPPERPLQLRDLTTGVNTTLSERPTCVPVGPVEVAGPGFP